MQGIFERCLIMLLTFVITSVKEAVLISDTICVKLLFTGEFNEFFRTCHLYSLTWSEAVPHFILIFTFYIYFDCWKWKVGLKIADKKEKNMSYQRKLCWGKWRIHGSTMSVPVHILPVFRRLFLRNGRRLNVCFEANEHSV